MRRSALTVVDADRPLAGVFLTGGTSSPDPMPDLGIYVVIVRSGGAHLTIDHPMQLGVGVMDALRTGITAMNPLQIPAGNDELQNLYATSRDLAGAGSIDYGQNVRMVFDADVAETFLRIIDTDAISRIVGIWEPGTLPLQYGRSMLPSNLTMTAEPQIPLRQYRDAYIAAFKTTFGADVAIRFIDTIDDDGIARLEVKLPRRASQSVSALMAKERAALALVEAHLPDAVGYFAVRYR